MLFTDDELFYIKKRARMNDTNGMVSVDNISTYKMFLGEPFADSSYQDKWDSMFGNNGQNI